MHFSAVLLCGLVPSCSFSAEPNGVRRRVPDRAEAIHWPKCHQQGKRARRRFATLFQSNKALRRSPHRFLVVNAGDPELLVIYLFHLSHATRSSTSGTFSNNVGRSHPCRVSPNRFHLSRFPDATFRGLLSAGVGFLWWPRGWGTSDRATFPKVNSMECFLGGKNVGLNCKRSSPRPLECERRRLVPREKTAA